LRGKKNADSEKILVKALKKLGADDVAASSVNDTRTMIKFCDNKITSVKEWDTCASDLFVAKDKRLMFSSVSDLTKERVGAVAARIMGRVNAVARNDDYVGLAQGPFKYSDVPDGYDKRVASLGKDAFDIVEGAINSALSAGVKRCSGVFEFGKQKISLVTTNSVSAKDRGTDAYLSIRVFSDAGSSGHAVCCSRTLKSLKIKKSLERACENALMSRKPKPCRPGNFEIVMDPLPFANLMQHVGAAASAYAVEAGFSFLGGKIGKKVASGCMSLEDNGLLANGLDSAKFDDEGAPSRRTAVIESGVLKTYLHNNSTAKRHNTKTTGNAGILSPEPTNIVIKPGDQKEEELVGSVRNGLYITNVWYTRFQNYLTGDFSTIPRDAVFYIKNGKIRHPVKNVRLSGSLPGVMKNIKALGRHLEQIKGWEVDTPVWCATANLSSMRVTKPTGDFPKVL